ncbi:MarR family winged helix-turn-helix transcriptional regulator [Mycobacteroides abscessus]|uniref:MarR family transcriptional regulator n=3 Tax=Mycobacteroides abscessus TaxID=36809 RepID=A0A1T8NSU5_9MYCO|nr:MarR family transcriptional regulator [Mycobacteroides abscessus]AGM29869.1 MarR family transcriptional regulator [Mycobacteroides abscessus subsp. bolletii 50594]ANO00087.1 transcriptional regulator [Mycobacteroides abscessus]ANO15234.1 transcriptional regulator [Mycobacteroides abscessus]ANO25310.1 transcriptional regulator [Mycobacteroides abscessus]ARQ65530.1 transcriptional regulator [Mycobacteroides abscessus subsp. massiliense]
MPRQSSGDSAREIEELVAATDALYFAMRRGRTSPAGTQAGMSRSQLELLAPLLDQESMSVSRLAGTAGVAVPTATRALKQLEERGIVARTRSSSDDRLVLVGLTSGGRARVIKAQSAFRARQQEVFEELSVADRRAMTDSLTRLAALINDNMDARA